MVPAGYRYYGIDHDTVNVVEINAIEVRKVPPLPAVGQNIFKHAQFERIIMISQHNGFHLLKYLERNSDFSIHQDMLDLMVGKHAARLSTQQQHLHHRFKGSVDQSL